MKTIEQLQEENAALAAQVEVLQCAIHESTRYLVSKLPSDFQWPAFLNSPAACLSQVRAEAVRDFVTFLPSYSYSINDLINLEANQYINSIRQEVE